MLDNETTGFYLDGSPSRMDFVSREKPSQIDWAKFNPEIEWSDSAEYVVLRASLFFHAGQKITLGKIREFYTPKAIKLLEKDGYIKIIIDHGEPE